LPVLSNGAKHRSSRERLLFRLDFQTEILDFDDVAKVQFSTPSRLDLTIDPHFAALDQELGLTSRFNDALELEELIETDFGQVSCGHLVSFGSIIGRRGIGPRAQAIGGNEGASGRIFRYSGGCARIAAGARNRLPARAAAIDASQDVNRGEGDESDGDDLLPVHG